MEDSQRNEVFGADGTVMVLGRLFSETVMPKIQPNNVTIDFTIDAGSGIISIPRALSLLNRRSYRSGYVYAVDYVEYIGGAGDIIKTGCLPASYPLFNAYQLGFSKWLEQRAEAIDDTGIEPGKWSDFKPWFSQDHLLGPGAGGFKEYVAQGLSGATLNLGDLDDTGAEWNLAEIIRNDHAAATTTTFLVGMLGDDDIPGLYGSLMNAYGDTTRPTLAPDPLTPNVASGSWITRTGEASGEMTQEVINLIEGENDFPPYANQNDVNLPPTYVGNGQSAPGGILLDVGLTGSTGRPITLNGGMLPLGYMIFHTTMIIPGSVATLRVHCTRGSYKGVAALSMGDFS